MLESIIFYFFFGSTALLISIYEAIHTYVRTQFFFFFFVFFLRTCVEEEPLVQGVGKEPLQVKSGKVRTYLLLGVKKWVHFIILVCVYYIHIT